MRMASAIKGKSSTIVKRAFRFRRAGCRLLGMGSASRPRPAARPKSRAAEQRDSDHNEDGEFPDREVMGHGPEVIAVRDLRTAMASILRRFLVVRNFGESAHA